MIKKDFNDEFEVLIASTAELIEPQKRLEKKGVEISTFSAKELALFILEVDVLTETSKKETEKLRIFIAKYKLEDRIAQWNLVNQS